MAPIIVELERRNIPLNLVFTGQHLETMDSLVEDFHIRTEPKYLYRGREITGILQMARWFATCLWQCIRHGEYFLPRTSGRKDIVLVHGDTMSTLLGAMAGRLRRLKIGHIEAGLRSHDVFHPFPEELIRIVVSRLCNLAFCPGSWAADNLVRGRCTIIDTAHNTLMDAVTIALEHDAPFPHDNNAQYGIVSIHRFENIFNAGRLASIVRMIELAASRYRLLFVLHPSTRGRLEKFDLLRKLESNPSIQLMPRMGFIKFIQLARRAKFVITDGGGNQEELSYLGIPTLLMRKATERNEGLQTTATLCRYDINTLEQFLDSLPGTHAGVRQEGISPSALIVDQLMAFSAPVQRPSLQ